MPQVMLAFSDYKLTDLLSTAGATIGVIIAGTIFLQFLSSKYNELSGRYRDLAGEYRGEKSGQPRYAPLRAQIRLYRRRLVLLNRASWLGAVALLCFLSALLSGWLSLVYPPSRVIKTVGMTGLFLGLLLMAAAVSLDLIERFLARHEIEEEVADLDDEVRGGSH
jgi:FtsH-binding integral membrane protein